jgi:hypothetical protein
MGAMRLTCRAGTARQILWPRSQAPAWEQRDIMSIITWLSSYGSLAIAGFALMVSLFTYNFLRKSWKETYRPIVTARISTVSSGNRGTALNIVVRNTGNRPAKNIRLLVNKTYLESILLAPLGDSMRNLIEDCFSLRTIIPILENERSVSNTFGYLSDREDSTWRVNSTLNVEILYESLEGRTFKHRIPLLLSDDSGFAGGFWGVIE